MICLALVLGAVSIQQLAGRLQAFGGTGGELSVNTTTTGSQTTWLQNIASDAAGNFVVVWADAGLDGSGYGVYGQRFDASGVAQGVEFRVNSFVTGDQRYPAVAMDADGDFVVVWASDGQDGSGQGIYAQRYDASGVAQGSEFRVNVTTANTQWLPTVAMDDGGDFVVTWTSNNQDGSGYGVYGRRYDSAGVAQDTEFRVNSYTQNSQWLSSVAMDAGGDFVVVWTSLDQDGSGYGIYGQRYDAAGAAQGAEFQVNTYTSNLQWYAAAAMDDDGDFVVVWMSFGQDGSGYGIYGQRFGADGLTQGGEFQINAVVASDQLYPTVGMAADGDFLVSWTSNGQDGSSFGVFARQFDSTGTAQGAEFQVNTTSTSAQWLSVVAVDTAGDAVVAWSGNGPGDADGVFAQRYVNEAPTISSVADQVTAEDTATGAIGFTVGDAETPVAELTLSGSSSNQLLVPDAGIVFGGAGASRTVTVTPALNQSGTATITLTVSDGLRGHTATDTFDVTVTAVNDTPTISDISDLSVASGSSTGAIAFTIGDAETPAASLGVTAGSSNTTLVPGANIALGGTGAARTVTITPAAGETGTATIGVTVSDGAATASDSFVLTVTAVNTAPTISDIVDQTVPQDTVLGPIAFTVDDLETPAATLAVTATSANESIIPTVGLVLGGTGTARTITVTPAAGQTGSTVVTVTVSDGTDVATDAFGVTVTSTGPFSLTLAAAGDGSGSITSAPAGIVCGSDCDETFTAGTVVALTLLPDAGSAFAGWTGPDDCLDGSVTMTDDLVCTAWFRPIAQAPVSRDTLDFDANGVGDVVWYEPVGGAWGVEFSTGSGGFASLRGTWSSGWEMTPADFDGDRLTDLFLYNPVTGAWFMALNTGRGTFDYRGGTWSPGWRLLAAELDGDGRSDLFLYNPDTGQWFWAVTSGPGQFTYRGSLYSPDWQITRVHLNADGLDDLFFYNRTTGQWYRMVNDGSGRFLYDGTAVHDDETPPAGLVRFWSAGWDVHPADLDGDGLSDLFLYQPASGQWYEAMNAGVDFTYQAGQWMGGSSVTLGDLSGDGIEDLFLYDPTTGAWYEATNQGVGQFEFRSDVWSGGWEIDTTSLDTDAMTDLVLYNATSGRWYSARRTEPGDFLYQTGSWAPGAVVLSRPSATLQR